MICGAIQAEQHDRNGKLILALYLVVLFLTAGYFVYRGTAGGFSFQSDFLLGLIAFLTTIVFLPLQYCAKSGDFTILAGYDAKEETNYRPEMLRRMVRALQLFLCISAFSFCVIFLLFRFSNVSGNCFVYLIILFVIDYIGGMIGISFKYQTLILKKPHRKSFCIFAIILVFIAMVAIWIAAMAWLADGKQSDDAWSVILTFGILAVTTPWMARELTQAIQAEKNEIKYRPSRFTIVAGALYLALLFYPAYLLIFLFEQIKRERLIKPLPFWIFSTHNCI